MFFGHFPLPAADCYHWSTFWSLSFLFIFPKHPHLRYQTLRQAHRHCSSPPILSSETHHRFSITGTSHISTIVKHRTSLHLLAGVTSRLLTGIHFSKNLLAGGTDTSATTVEWAILELLKNPKILKKAINELDEVIGNQRWVQENDFPHRLPYIESTIMKETLRLHPLTTLLAPHFSIQDCKIDDYDILKGTTVFVNTWSIGRDPQYWDEPEEFKPERFLGKNANVDVKGQNFELLPFGAGRRRCLGYRLGLNVVRSTLANLLHGFVWKLPNEMKVGDICMDELYGLTTHPKVSLSLVLEPRLPSHLY